LFVFLDLGIKAGRILKLADSILHDQFSDSIEAAQNSKLTLPTEYSIVSATIILQILGTSDNFFRHIHTDKSEWQLDFGKCKIRKNRS